MSSDGGNKLSKIEELKSRLFSKNYHVETKHRDSFSHHNTTDVLDSWSVKEKSSNNTGENFFMRTSLFKKFFIFSVIFFLFALGYGFYVFFVGGNTVSNSNIDIAVLGDSFTAGGDELPLQISITNKNTLSLDLVDLVVEYPKSSSGDLSGEIERIRESLGVIPSGTVRNENVNVVLFGAQGSVRPIKITLEYRIEGSNAIFVKEKIYEVSINSTPVNISINAPNDISSNQEFIIDIKSTLNSTNAVSGMIMKANYPFGFQFISANPAPSSGNNVWNLGDAAPGSERNIRIIGKMVDVFDGEEKTFKIESGLQSKTDKSDIDTVFNSASHILLIKKPFLTADFLIAGVEQREYAVDSRSKITGEIRWTNNLDTQVNDLKITAKLSGNALNRKSVTSQQGFYDSANDTIVWDRNSLSSFGEISPGESGSLLFSFSPISLFSLSGVTSSPSITVDIAISGKQDVGGYETEGLKNSDSSVIKIISDVGFANKVLYYSGPFTNSGPIPPKVGEETTYTIAWSLSNSSNNISKGLVRSSLPTWVNFVGSISPSTEDLTYNPSTREIIWNVGNINRGVGITSANREVYFRVSLSPSLSQVGTAPILIKESALTGYDSFANVDIRLSKPALYTRVNNDLGFPENGDRVVE